MKKYSFEILIFLVSTFLFFSIYNEGKSYRMHKIVPSPAESLGWSMATALSDLQYNLNKGYLYYINVWEELRKNGVDSSSSKFPESLRDEATLQRGLTDAASLKINKNNNSLLRREVRPIAFTTSGYVDFFKLSYRIFGYNISAPYNFLFVLLAVISLIFFFAFIM